MSLQLVRKEIFFLLLSVLLLLSGCNIGQQPSDNRLDSSGRIILWHTWSGAEEEALSRLLHRFRDAYPDIRVISISFDPEQLEREYTQKVNQGLGPDMLIGPQLWAPRLVDEDLIRPLDEWEIESSEFSTSTALDTLIYHSQLYGIPLALQTYGLFYHLDGVETPPTTLDELLEHAEAGRAVGIDTTFESAFWGVRAFGGNLLDEDGRIVLNQGGFANWLEWLIEARGTPNVILSDDSDVLLGLFETNDLDYYVGKSSELLNLRETMGSTTFGVSPLPSGPTDVAGPFLTTEALYFSTASSAPQLERARLLAEFLTNTEQQRTLAQETARIPANPRVNIDRRITPAVAAFAEQSKTATPLLLLPQVFDVIQYGQESYVQAIEGITAPAEAADTLTAAVNTEHGFEASESIVDTVCTINGTLDVWHSWSGSSETVLGDLAAEFATMCPGVLVNLEAYPVDSLVEAYEAALRTSSEPDLMLISSEQVPRLAESGSIVSLEEQFDTAFLQRYVPVAPDAMRHAGQLFGIPLTMETDALYYNRAMVETPPYDLSDLLNQIGPERQLAFAYTPFEAAHWGIGAFGGQLFDTSGNLAINQGGVAEWLAWLQAADDTLGMELLRNNENAQALFTDGEAAYYVGSSSDLSTFQNILGSDRVGIVPLPSGPEGISSPLLTVDGLVMGPNGAQNPDPVVEFSRFLASQESQRQLMRIANLVPANINVEDANLYPAISGFMEQASNATVLPSQPEVQTVLALGEKIYENVLEEKGDPNVVLDNFTAFLLRLHTDPVDRELTAICGGVDGEVNVWHSLEGLQEQVLDQIVIDYAQLCPAISVNLIHVPAVELPNQLAASSLEHNDGDALPQPDLLLASHDLITPFSQERLIKPISNLIDDSTLIPYYSQAIAPLRHEGSLYGLPFAMRTAVLFYDTETAEDPPFNLTRLFSSVTPETPFAIETNFIDGFWGVSGHNPDIQKDPEAISSGEQDLADVFQKGIEDWLKKLQSTQKRPGIVVSPDANQLQELFLIGKASYLTADSDALSLLRSEKYDEENGTSTLGVAMLPKGPTAASAPLMTVDALLFGAESDDDQSRLALRFAEFATSGQSQSQLVSEAASVPANALALKIVEDTQIEEVVRQTDVSVPMPPRSEAMVLEEFGNALYASVLDELKPATTAVDSFFTSLATASRPAIVVSSKDAAITCVHEGQLSIWLGLWPNDIEPDNPASADFVAQAFPSMAEIIDSFEAACPTVDIELDFIPHEQLHDRLSEASEDGTVPDLVLSKHTSIMPLVDDSLIHPITDVLSPEFLDRFDSKLMSAVSHKDELYGIPMTMESVALYYNSDLIDGSVGLTLETLVENVPDDAPIAMSSEFRDAFWGIAAFGEPLVDGDGELNLTQSGLESWLTWLRSNQSNPNFQITGDGDQLKQQFIAGDASYLVEGPRALAELRERMGEQVRVVSLPDGPNGDAAPLVDVGAFFVTTNDEQQNQLALVFADFATSESMQGLLLQPGSLLPVHRTVIAATSDPALESFITMSSDAGIVLSPETERMIGNAGELLNQQAFEDDTEIRVLLDAFSQEVDLLTADE